MMDDPSLSPIRVPALGWVQPAALLLAAAFPMLSDAQAPSEGDAYVGAAACGSCHPEQLEVQARSGHATTLHRAQDHPLASRFVPAEALRRSPKYRFRYQLGGDRIVVQADDSEYVMELPVEWAFGAGDHGVTFVSRLNRRSYLEHAFSYYSATDALDITTGHETIQPETLLQAMGLRYSVRGPGNSISNCFQCHSTGPLAYTSSGEVEVHELGVRCESCHGPGRGHVDAVAAGSAERARAEIRNPIDLPADDLLQMCGTCHRDPKGGSGAFDFGLAWNVRHQPPYFRQSACFGGSGERLTCFTCHDPHGPVRRGQPAYYRARCLACHGSEARPPADSCEAGRVSDCTGCHMPTVEVSPHLKFKNHWIGIYAEGDSLVPRRQ